MKNLLKSRLLQIISVLAVVIILIFSTFLYNFFIRDEINALSDQSIQQLMDNNVDTFKLEFESNINLLESTASLLPVWDYLRYVDYDSGEYDYIAESFDYVMVINPYGYAVGSDGNVGDAFDEPYFQNAMNGETTISELIATDQNGIYTIVISTPMIANGETRGVLAGLNYVETLNGIFGNPIDGIVANLLVDSKGNIISNGVDNTYFNPAENAFDVISNFDLTDHDQFDLLKTDILNGNSGEKKIEFDGELYRLIYTPVGVKDWSIMSIIPETIIQSTTNHIIILSAVVSSCLVLIICLFAYLIGMTRRKNLKNLEEIAYVSPLTKLNTLAKFKLDAPKFINEHHTKKFLLIKFDVENFRLVNETLSALEGDKILINMAASIESEVTYDSLSAHIYNDEFLTLIAYTNDETENWYDDYKSRLYKKLGKNFKYNLRIVSGYYYIDESDMLDIQACIEKVNIAHHNAKEEKLHTSIFSVEYLSDAIKAKEIENSMEKALLNGEFKMVLQPELGLKSGKMIAAEALVRWISPTAGFRAPNEFIPLFEKNGFIVKLDMYMFEKACNFLNLWKKEGKNPFVISVNFSRKNLYSADFVSNLTAICKKYDVNPKYLGIEITETSMLSTDCDLNSFINDLHKEGFKVLMDDFGIGYSSLGLLKNTPVDVLKLDRSFFVASQTRERGIAVVASVIRLSKDLNINTVAEGIETIEDLTMLKQMDCDIVQGYYYAKPMFEDDFRLFYDSEKSKMKL